jgi:plastocyanin
MLLATFAMAACSTTAAAPAPPSTPVPPAALATTPPARPIAVPGTAGGPQLEIANFNFTPAELTVPVGGTVTWTNNDDAPHTVTSADKIFSSPSINTDGQFTFTFTTAGTYAYFCAIHPFMTGKVTVQ